MINQVSIQYLCDTCNTRIYATYTHDTDPPLEELDDETCIYQACPGLMKYTALETTDGPYSPEIFRSRIFGKARTYFDIFFPEDEV